MFLMSNFVGMKNTGLIVFNYKVLNKDSKSVDIHIDGYIVDSPTQELYAEYWGDETSVSYKSFRDSIPADVEEINLIVNSGGGHVGDAMAIHDFLASLEDKGVTVNREGRGIVASAATYLVMGKNSKLSENSLFMIHEVSGFAYGSVTEMENQVKSVRKFNQMIVDFYARETGLSKEEIDNMMKEETWLNATEAKEKGFVKNTSGAVQISNRIPAEKWPFQNQAILNTYNNFFNPKNTSDMDANKIQEAITNGFNKVLEALNLKGKSEDEKVKNAFNDFSKSIVDAIQENKPEAAEVDEETLNSKIKEAVANTLKDLSTDEGFTTTVNNAVDAKIKESTKNLVTGDVLKAEFDKLNKAITDKLGNKNNGGAEDEGEGKKRNSAGRKLPNNRFAKAYDEYYPN